jgi:dihydrofolate synthase / folylpolyglutamate synthase
MNYTETIDYLICRLPMYQRVGRAAYKEGLDNTYKLDKYFNHPHRAFRTIHVAGTNGKGSVSHMIASVLQHAGYKTGLHTSPHLNDFRERIRVNGIPIPEPAVVTFVEKHTEFFEKINPSFFEMSVFMAFDHFRAEKVDVAVIEVGLGGRLDSTNIITPVLSVITNIGLDHTEFLGDTYEKIAREKAGIIKDDVPVVIGEDHPETRPVFERVAFEHSAPVLFASDNYEQLFHTYTVYDTQIIRYKNKQANKKTIVETDLRGLYQIKNVATVMTSLDEMKRTFSLIDKRSVSAGLKTVQLTTGLKGRWQIAGHNPLVICDTAHNAEGLLEVVTHLRQTPHKHLHMVLGFVKDKDMNKILGILPQEALYYFATPSVPRGLESSAVHAFARDKKLQARYFNTAGDAFNQARQNAGANDLIFIGGSNFLVADFLEYIGS